MIPDLAANAAFPPAAILIVAGVLLPFARGRLRSALIVIAPLITLYLVWHLPAGTTPAAVHAPVAVRGDALSQLFAILFSILALIGGLFALRQRNALELSAAFICAGSAVGVALAGDLITVFIFWTLMAIASTFVIISAGPGADRPARRYAVIHLLGIVLLMAGIAGEIATAGSLALRPMALDSVARGLMLAGFLIGAGAPPLSAWIADAYSEASWSGTVFLSAFTGKAAVCVLIHAFPGADVLIYFGLVMAFYGILYALLANDIRGILAYVAVNQIGIMLVGIGIGTELALNGAAAFAFVHGLYSALLFMAAGSVLLLTGRHRCTDLGGLYRTMPLTTIFTIIGALSIASFPLTAGFAATAIIAEAAALQGFEIVWYLLVAATAGVILAAGLRFPWMVFFRQDSGLRPPDPPPSLRFAMMLLCGICIGIGIMPGALYALLPYAMDYAPYTASHLVVALQLVAFSGLAFVLFLHWLKPAPGITLDTDWFYRALGRVLARMAERWVARFPS